ncbi:hypothetical protein [Streptomyces sp. S07_1.15]|nr:hypothetical protein [Streptomyces sp. S07_1.15]
MSGHAKPAAFSPRSPRVARLADPGEGRVTRAVLHDVDGGRLTA